MKKNTQVIVITRNTWLYEGIAALLPGVRCLLMRFDVSYLPDEFEDSGRTLVLVDSMLIFGGLWDAIKTLKAVVAEPEVVWLSLDYTGNLVPACWRDSWFLEQKQPAATLIRRLTNIMRPSSLPYRRQGSVWLTKKERFLLPYFMSDLSMKRIAKMTGVLPKTLYLHRRNILLKTGFRQIVFLRFVYRKGRELRDSALQPGYSGVNDIFIFPTRGFSCEISTFGKPHMLSAQ